MVSAVASQSASERPPSLARGAVDARAGERAIRLVEHKWHGRVVVQLAPLFVSMADFVLAVKKVQPSSKREGCAPNCNRASEQEWQVNVSLRRFATAPDVTWDDVGALDALREELSLTILQVGCPRPSQRR